MFILWFLVYRKCDIIELMTEDDFNEFEEDISLDEMEPSEEDLMAIENEEFEEE